jgi:dihydroorotate dehydrogenase
MLPFDLWRFPGLDPYRLLRPILFRIDAEQAHSLALKLLIKRLGPKVPKLLKKGFKVKNSDDPVLHTSICGLNFKNPIGLAAGFDKNAEAIDELLAMGFGFVEIGTITSLPQPGNPKPRLFRLPEAKAIINRLGFNSDGMDICLRRLKVWHDSTQPQKGDHARGLVGINIGINKDCKDPAADYAAGYRQVAPYAGYVTINISSPNTPGLRDLQGRALLTELLQKVTAERTASVQKPPIFIKVGPDLTDAQAEDIAAVVLNADVQGMIIGNTTVTRPGSLPAELAKEAGGLSGQPLFALSTDMLAQMYKLTEGKIPLIGCGGIATGKDAYVKIRAGASLVQLYSALVFEGPGVVRRIKRELTALLKRDGFSSVRDAVGTSGK